MIHSAKEHLRLGKEHRELRVEEANIGKKLKELHQKIVSVDNVFKTKDLNKFRKGTLKRAQLNQKKARYNPRDTKYNLFLKGELEHESQHAEVNKRYGLPTTYCYIDFIEPYGFQLFTYVEDLDKLTDGWTEYKIAKYYIEVEIAPTKLSYGDIEGLKARRKIIELNSVLTTEQVKELLEIINKRIK